MIMDLLFLACNTLDIIISVPARIPNSREPSTVSVVQRGAIRLECRPYGTPEPNITWFKDGEPMNLTEARHIRILQNGQTLQIIGATVEDSAGYTCSAKNEAGQDQKLFRLEVHGEKLELRSSISNFTRSYIIHQLIFYMLNC